MKPRSDQAAPVRLARVLAAALLMLEDDLPKKRRLEDLPRWLEVIVDLVDLVVDIVT